MLETRVFASQTDQRITEPATGGRAHLRKDKSNNINRAGRLGSQEEKRVNCRSKGGKTTKRPWLQEKKPEKPKQKERDIGMDL